jgi:voltage-gated sodium channel
MVNLCKQIALSAWFEKTIIGLILFTALLLGIEAFPQFMTGQIRTLFDLLHQMILIAFILEALIKIVAQAPRPFNYFRSGWNVFDFSLIALSLLPVAGQTVLLARVFRLLRVLRLINAWPELRLIVETLVRSIPSMLHITALMGILFFIYAVLGFHLFSEHDPTHWRDLSYAMLTLFRIVTLEDWTDVMYTAMELSPAYALYFVSFVVIGTFVVINLFIAVVINNLDEAKYAHLQTLTHPELHDQMLSTMVETKNSLQMLEKKLNLLRTQGLSKQGNTKHD